MVNGNSDLVIRTRRIGTNYSRSATDKRKQYDREQISDPKILRILENVPGVFPRQATPASKTTTNENKETTNYVIKRYRNESNSKL